MILSNFAFLLARFLCYSQLQDIRFISMLKDSQPIKTINQMKDFFDKILFEFQNDKAEPETSFIDLNSYNIYQLRTKNELVSNLYIQKNKFYGLDKNNDVKSATLLCFYCVYTNKDYRGKGLASLLIEKSISHNVQEIKKKECLEKNAFNLRFFMSSFINCLSHFYKKKENRNVTKSFIDSDIILGLHLDPKDPMMNFNYAFYYSLGFKKGSVCEYGPTSFKYRLEEIDQLEETRIARKNVLRSKEKGYMFCMFCKYDDFINGIGKEKIIPIMIEEGEELRKDLLHKKGLEKVDEDENM